MKFAAKFIAALMLLSIIWVIVLKWVPVRLTPLMVKRMVEYRNDDSYHTRQVWTSIDDISPELMKAVVTAEDNFFVMHYGFDLKAIKQAIQEHEKDGERLRGASTISQQTAKNVFLWDGRNWFRKALEAYYTVLIELIWGKERILEVYLNVAEMGVGLYGAEAAAMGHFGVHASQLTQRQACLIAACLPNPRARNAGHPNNYTIAYAETIQQRLNNLIYPEWFYSKHKKAIRKRPRKDA